MKRKSFVLEAFEIWTPSLLNCRLGQHAEQFQTKDETCFEEFQTQTFSIERSSEDDFSFQEVCKKKNQQQKKKTKSENALGRLFLQRFVRQRFGKSATLRWGPTCQSPSSKDFSFHQKPTLFPPTYFALFKFIPIFVFFFLKTSLPLKGLRDYFPRSFGFEIKQEVSVKGPNKRLV